MEIEIEQNTAYETVVAGRELLALCVERMRAEPLTDFSHAAIGLNVMLDELAEAADVEVPPVAGWYKARGQVGTPAAVSAPAGVEAMKRRAIAAEEEARRLRFYLEAHPCSKCKAELWWDARRARWNDEYLDNRVTARGNTSRWGGKSYPHIHQPTLPAVF